MRRSSEQQHQHRDSAIGGSEDEEEATKIPLKIREDTIWNLFRDPPRATEVRPYEESSWYQRTTIFLKILTYVIVSCAVLTSSVVALMTMLLMTSQLQPDLKRPLCLEPMTRGLKEVEISIFERIQWTWTILFCLLIPELLTFFRCLRICVFKKCPAPNWFEFCLPCFFEVSHAVGLALLAFTVLPHEHVIKGAMLSHLTSVLPGILGLLSRSRDDSKNGCILAGLCLMDFLAILVQLGGLAMWTFVNFQNNQKIDHPWLLPVAAILISFGWWENYLSRSSKFSIIKSLAQSRPKFEETRHKSYLYISLLKMAAFILTMFLSTWLVGEDPWDYLKYFKNSFQKSSTLRWNYLFDSLSNGVTTLNMSLSQPNIAAQILIVQKTFPLENTPSAMQLTLLTQFVTSYLCYIIGKYACKICMQEMAFAFPLTLTIPASIATLIFLCGSRAENVCFAKDFLPGYLFWECPSDSLVNFVLNDYGWLWPLIFLSQIWIAVHIWRPQRDPLPSTESIFCRPMYNALCPSVDVIFNRKKYFEKTYEEPTDTENNKKMTTVTTTVATDNDKDTEWDHTPKICACVTLWHETGAEMLRMLKSIFRLDSDHNMWKQTLSFVQRRPRGYYELTSHIFFDDAFTQRHRNGPYQLNHFVQEMMAAVDAACKKVHREAYVLRPPKKIETPYGGRLEWIMPGGTKLYVHLKNRHKIRHKKRWSQNMYIYYLLGYGIKRSRFERGRQQVIAENTFILALDGDIDFQPQAVKTLVDLMRKNKKLGAACGRIHPMGQGPMVWFQQFEYAIGHWLQKATEHMIGCVLCSPGCFSLFRAAALMDDGVAKRYTTMSKLPRHFVQYDQGEDRWLCTLLLQQGWKIEYAAASNAYTNAPESFDEFYNQRRRWIPSTMANVMDLLADYKRTIKMNDNISKGYIAYQVVLFVGGILGPGTIFLMLVGSFVAAFNIDNYTSLCLNIIPIKIFMAVCFMCKKEVQLAAAKLLSTLYVLVMVAVLVAISIQMVDDGLLAPSSIFLLAITFSFIMAAMMHPLEFFCLVHGFLYYLTIPSMYLLLIIYSLFNLNDVSWGTRDTQTKILNKFSTKPPKLRNDTKSSRFFGGILPNFRIASSNSGGGAGGDGISKGYFEIIFGTLFEIYCCITPRHAFPGDDEDDEEALLKMRDTEIQNGWRRSTSVVEDDGWGEREESGQVLDEADHPEHWFHDETLVGAVPDSIFEGEKKFWEEAVETFLKPAKNENDPEVMKERKLLEAGLLDLRNKVIAAFFMINGIFVTALFVLQLNKNVLFIEWPLGGTHNMTFDGLSTVTVQATYLHLEPFGLLFVGFYTLILLTQFLAMLFHRFGTFSLIMASTPLFFESKNKKFKTNQGDLEEDEIGLEELKIIRSIHRAKRGSEETLDAAPGIVGGHNSGQSRRDRWRPKKRPSPVHSMDVIFRKKFERIARSPSQIRRHLNFVENPEAKLSRMTSVQKSNMEQRVQQQERQNYVAPSMDEIFGGRRLYDEPVMTSGPSSSKSATSGQGAIPEGGGKWKKMGAMTWRENF